MHIKNKSQECKLTIWFRLYDLPLKTQAHGFTSPVLTEYLYVTILLYFSMLEVAEPFQFYCVERSKALSLVFMPSSHDVF
jgi:hypothetical protein